MDDFLIRAFAAGIGVAIIAGAGGAALLALAATSDDERVVTPF